MHITKSTIICVSIIITLLPMEVVYFSITKINKYQMIPEMVAVHKTTKLNLWTDSYYALFSIDSIHYKAIVN